jgi:hypothetical protein
MRKVAAVLGLSAALLLGGGCKKQQSDNDAIRAGIMTHLNGLSGINVNAMVMDIKSVSINGNQAHAEVEFRPKTGAPPGAGMQVAYNLEKRDGAWVVQKTQPMGGMIQHPDPNENPHKNQDVHSGSLPNFSDIVSPAGAPPQGAAPAKAQPGAQSSDPYQTPAKKP